MSNRDSRETMPHTARPGDPTSGLYRLFKPCSIAIVGASSNLQAIGGQPVKHLTDHGYPGTIYPVNPKYEEIAGHRCYPDLASLPAVPDLVVIAVAASLVSEQIQAAGKKRVPFVVVFSSGFAETGSDGQTAQTNLQVVAKTAGVTLIGPNCQGLINISDDIPVGFGAPYGLSYRQGPVSLTSQSGAFGNSLLMALNDEGVGMRHYVSTGNEASTSSLDFFEHFIDDPETRVIAAYIEGFRDAYRLREVATKALRQRKPIVVWKVGNTDAGAKAASSHTANLAGGSTYYRAAFRQYGVIAVNDIGDMADCARALLTDRIPLRGKGVAVLSISGGAGIAMTDRCVELGLDIVQFSPSTECGLSELMPDFASTVNPVDMTGAALNAPEAFASALRLIIDDPAVDMLGLCLAALSGPAALTVAETIVAVSRDYDVPILVAWNAPAHMNSGVYELLEDAGIPVYSSPVRCARGFGALAEYADGLNRLRSPDMDYKVGPPMAAGDKSKSRTLNEFNSKKLLTEYGVPVTAEAVANDSNQAVEIAQKMGYPVALKLLSADLLHKSDIGGVRINLDDADAVRQAYDGFSSIIKSPGTGIEFDGVLVQEMVPAGIEVILGAVNDAGFGPVIMFGAGGVFTEIFKDVAFRLAPLTPQDARELIAETRTAQLLQGARGAQPYDVEALVRCILRLSEFVVNEQHRFSEIDINPLIVLSKGEGAKVADALVRLES